MSEEMISFVKIDNYTIMRWIGIQRLLFLILVLFFVYICLRIIKKINVEYLELISSFVLLVLVFQYGYGIMTGSTFLSYILTSILSIMAIFSIQYKEYKLSDYILLLAIVLLTTIIKPFMCFEISSIVIAILGSLLIITKQMVGAIKGRILTIWLSGMMGVVNYYAFYYLYDKFVREIYYSFINQHDVNNNLNKILFFSVIGIAYFIIMYVLFIIIRMLIGRKLNEIKYLGEKYDEIERFFVLFTVAFLAVMIVSEVMEAFFESTNERKYLLAFFAVFVLGMQFIYLRLLIKTVGLKEHLELTENEKQNLLIYNSDLEKNMNDIRAIKHDIKNLFLTMGEFVETSDNELMKEYYKERIFPIAENEVKNNDIYSKLQFIPDEPFRAFLYYKLMQGMDNNIDIQLNINIEDTFKNISSHIEIIRILGIFLDNAIEECVAYEQAATSSQAIHIENGQLILELIQKENVLNIKVGNTVRKSIRITGVNAGTTTKGLGRGNGLVIVRDIISKYDNIVLNTYFKDEFFIQSLNIEEKE